MSDRRECDVLVLGAGVAGLATALAAAHQGLRVIVAEKSAHFGGTAAISAGWAWVPGNPKGAAATGDTREEVETYLKALAPDTYDAPRVEAFLERHDIDVLALQETKAREDQLPLMGLQARGYDVAAVGYSQWNGVAIISRVGLEDVQVGFEGMPRLSIGMNEV